MHGDTGYAELRQELDEMAGSLDEALDRRRPSLNGLKRLLVDVRADVRALRRAYDEEEVADDLLALEDDLSEAVRYLRDEERGFTWTYADDRPPRIRTYGDDDVSDDDYEEDDWDHRFDFDWDWDWDVDLIDVDDYGSALVGAPTGSWPYRATALYRPIPSIRYNRVEGTVLGVGFSPLAWDDHDRTALYGQIGYAFALDRVRYEIGVETRPGYERNEPFGVKFGAVYRRNTTTDDIWKVGWLENSLGGFLFENDFFDYYETEGWTFYGVQRLTPFAQVSAGYRTEEHRSLERNTFYSVFQSGTFRENIVADEGRMASAVFTLEGGRVRGLQSLPRGVAFRAEAELGQGLGGDFSFNRYTGDVRTYMPLNRFSSLSLRLRGGLATGDVPLQKQYTIGGQGSLRGYPQNALFGERLVLANAEYTVAEVDLLDDLFDDLQIFGFGDAGWTNRFAGTNRFQLDDMLASAGFGVGLDERTVRLELAWPLNDAFGNTSPALWLRFSPTF